MDIIGVLLNRLGILLRSTSRKIDVLPNQKRNSGRSSCDGCNKNNSLSFKASAFHGPKPYIDRFITDNASAIVCPIGYPFVLHNRRRARKIDIVNFKLLYDRRLIKSGLFHPFGDFEYGIPSVFNLVASKRIFVA